MWTCWRQQHSSPWPFCRRAGPRNLSRCVLSGRRVEIGGTFWRSPSIGGRLCLLLLLAAVAARLFAVLQAAAPHPSRTRAGGNLQDMQNVRGLVPLPNFVHRGDSCAGRPSSLHRGHNPPNVRYPSIRVPDPGTALSIQSLLGGALALTAHNWLGSLTPVPPSFWTPGPLWDALDLTGFQHRRWRR